MKSKFTAGFLCLLLGGLGLHEFYLGDTKKGCYYIIAFIVCAVTGWGAVLYVLFQVGVAIHYFIMDQAKFDEKYNGITPGTKDAYNGSFDASKSRKTGPTIVVEESSVHETPRPSKVDKLKELKLLLDEGLISQDEFEIKKQKILNS